MFQAARLKKNKLVGATKTLYWKATSRLPFLQEALVIAGVIIVAYYLFVTLSSVAIYRYNKSNFWTNTAERLFPYPAIFIDNQSIPLSRIRLETEARRNFTQRQGQHSSDTEIQA